jgi:flagellar hook-associated protein 1 FlgK
MEYSSAASSVAQQVTSIHSGLNMLQQQQIKDLQTAVEQVNSLSGQISELNRQIQTIQAAGSDSATLQDNRDQLIQQLGQLVDLNPASLANPDSTLVGADGWLVVSSNSPQLSVKIAVDGSAQVVMGDSQQVVQPKSGKIAGLLTTIQKTIPEARAELQSWASAFVSGVNHAQATGVSLNGQVSKLTGTLSVTDPTIPLQQSVTQFPMQAGQLVVSMTNLSTGERETVPVAIDPRTDSLNDVVSRLNAVSHLHASVTSAGELMLQADDGYGIDFTGLPGSQVDTSLMTGTSIPKIDGSYAGVSNSSWQINVISSGQVGYTTPLTLQVTDLSTGAVTKTVDVGAGYAPGQPIEIAPGVTFTLSSGTLNTGDTFTVNAVSDSDSAGFLTALGVGGLFETDNLTSLRVNQAILNDPALIAAGRTGDPADSSQMIQLLAFRDAKILNGGSESVEDALATITSNAGMKVNSQQTVVDQLTSQQELLKDRQAATSGVDPNEELLSMMQFQRAFQANARFLSSVNTALDDLLGILR